MTTLLRWLGWLKGLFSKKSKPVTFTLKAPPAPVPDGPRYEEIHGSKDPFGEWFHLCCIKERLRLDEDWMWGIHETQTRIKLREAIATANMWAMKALIETNLTQDRPTPTIFPASSGGTWAKSTGFGPVEIVKEPFFHDTSSPNS